MSRAILAQVSGFELQLLDFEAEARAVIMVHGGLTAEDLDSEDPFGEKLAAWEKRREDLSGRGVDELSPDELGELDRVRYLAQLASHFGAVRALRENAAAMGRQVARRVARASRRAKLGADSFREAPGVADPVDYDAAVRELAALHRERHVLKREQDMRDVGAELAPVEKRLGEERDRLGQALSSDTLALFAEALSGGGGEAKGGEDVLGRQLSRLRFLARPIRDRLAQRELAHDRRKYWFRLAGAKAGEAPVGRLSPVVSAKGRANVFNTAHAANLAFAALFISALLAMILRARRTPDLFIRKIPGLDAIDEAIGRATEMGRPVLFIHGLSSVGDIAVLASLNILGRVAEQIATYDSRVIVANSDPIVYAISQEVVSEGCIAAGRPDVYNRDDVFMCATEQFPFVAAVAGIMSREVPAANLFMGYFYAESLILAEAGWSTGAIQIAGTDSFTQLPFFVTTCDYTLMGEELYAASAYLSREPKLLGTLKAQDWGKAVIAALILAGVVLHFAAPDWNIVSVLLKLYV
jgi:hypothetical protein